MARRVLALVASLGLLIAVALPAAARNINSQNLYTVHNLQSDIADAAAATDPDLVNGWGIVASPTSPWWVADEAVDKSTLYNGNTGAKLGLVVSVPGGPTGIVFNGSTDFKVNAGTGLAPARFIFDTGDGHIRGWNGVGTLAIDAASTLDAVYRGLAIGSTGGANYLYATNFAAAHVDVFDKDYAPVSLTGDFVDPGLPAGYAPFGIQNIGGEIFIAFAKADGDEEVTGAGLGYVSAFGTDGTFHGRSRSMASGASASATAPTPARGIRCSSRPDPTTRPTGCSGRSPRRRALSPQPRRQVRHSATWRRYAKRRRHEPRIGKTPRRNRVDARGSAEPPCAMPSGKSAPGGEEAIQARTDQQICFG
jgi:hypothetical protein